MTGVQTCALPIYMTGLAKRLEQKNFIDRKPDPNDERVTLLVITKKGQKTLKLIEDKKNEAIDIILADLAPTEKEQFLETIKKIIKATGPFQKAKQDDAL